MHSPLLKTLQKARNDCRALTGSFQRDWTDQFSDGAPDLVLPWGVPRDRCRAPIWGAEREKLISVLSGDFRENCQKGAPSWQFIKKDTKIPFQGLVKNPWKKKKKCNVKNYPFEGRKHSVTPTAQTSVFTTREKEREMLSDIYLSWKKGRGDLNRSV